MVSGGRLRSAFGSVWPLRHRDFALLWSSALLSNVGNWMQTVAVGVLVTARTGRAGWAGLVAAAGFLPLGLLSPVGGAISDRIDRRHWLIFTTVGEAAFATVLALLAATGNASPAAVTLTVFAGQCMAGLGLAAYMSMLPDLVEPDEVLSAISLSSAQFNLGRVIGPVVAGVVIVSAGYTWAFAINAASFFAVVVALLLVRWRSGVNAEHEAGPMVRRLLSGWRVAISEPGCRAAIILISVVALLASPFIALVPAVAIKLFHRGASGTSVLVAAQGLGAIVGVLALTPLSRRFGPRRLLVADLFVLPAVLVGYGLAPTLQLAAVALFAVGLSYIWILSGLSTVAQMSAPAWARGRVVGIYMMALGIGYPIGAVIQGGIADRAGLRPVVVGGAVILAALVFAFVLGRPKLAAGLDQARMGFATSGGDDLRGEAGTSQTPPSGDAPAAGDAGVAGHRPTDSRSSRE